MAGSALGALVIGPVGAAIAAGVAAVGAATWGFSALVVRGSPDEWLLQVRDGALVRGGVGISVLRWPTDRIVRFPAAVQRVRFEAEALTRELIPVRVHAFALWSVLPEDPLLAVRRLGLSSQRSGAHLLSRPQHHAFQQAFSALVRRHAGTLALADLCREPAPLADAVLADAVRDLADLGVRVEGVQVIEVRPTAPAMLSRLSATVDEAIAREANRAADETRRERDQLEARAAQERQRAQIAAEVAVQEERERLEARRRELAAAALEAELALSRSRAEGEAAVARIAAEAEADRPAELRTYELARLRTEALSRTLAAWPVKEARWIGFEGPVAAVERILGVIEEA